MAPEDMHHDVSQHLHARASLKRANVLAPDALGQREIPAHDMVDDLQQEWYDVHRPPQELS